MKLSLLTVVSALMVMGANANPLIPEKKNLLDICAFVDADLTGEVLGNTKVFGHLDLCLCVSALPLFITTNVAAIAAVEALGVLDVLGALDALIHAAPPCSPKTTSKWKRDHTLADACPRGHSVCGVQSSWSRSSWECIDTQNDLESCGGCSVGIFGQAATGEDCSAIPNVEDVTCRRGSCQVLSCRHGYRVSAKGSTCIPTKNTHNAGAILGN